MRLCGYSSALTLVLSSLATSDAFVVVPSSAGVGVGVVSSRSRPLFGIMDEVNSDAFLLGQGGDDAGDPTLDSRLKEAYEMFLAELVFSPNDPRLDIVENADKALDQGFIAYLQTKVESSTDPEESIALRDLRRMILEIKEKLDLKRQQEEREETEAAEAEAARLAALEREAVEGGALSDADVLRRASVVDNAEVRKEMGLDPDDLEGMGASGGGAKQSFYETELSPEIRSSYEKLLKRLLPPYKGAQTVDTVVAKQYDKIDAQLVKVLNERASNGDADSQAVLDALATEQQRRVATATETLREVLATGDPGRMEGAIVRMTREDRVDEAFLLLLQANADQARAAGANGPADLMERLKERALREKDKAMNASKEIVLVRRLLRTDDKDERIALLEEAFTPREALIVPGTADNLQRAADGERNEEEKPMPDVSPPDFINACKAVMINFGNIGTSDASGQADLAAKIKEIAADAEVVATRIYGQNMSSEEQQDRMWKDCTTSIFDLETMEIEAERMGDKAPWSTENEDILPGFDKDGRMKVGGG